LRAQVPSPQNKPVLDERAFQLLLAAAYVLQGQNESPADQEAKVDCAQTLSDRGSAEVGEPIKLPAKDVLEPAQPEPVHFARPPHPHRTGGKPFLLSDELFWKVAIAATVGAGLALLLGAPMHVSSLPAGVSLPSEVVQKPMPFQGTKRIIWSPAPISSVGTNRGAPELSAVATAATSIVAAAVTDRPSASGVSLASAGTKIVKTHRFHAAHSRADMIAKDTVIRYGPGSASPSLDGRKN
jgi:hypothetical protein